MRVPNISIADNTQALWTTTKKVSAHKSRLEFLSLVMKHSLHNVKNDKIAALGPPHYITHIFPSE